MEYVNRKGKKERDEEKFSKDKDRGFNYGYRTDFNEPPKTKMEVDLVKLAKSLQGMDIYGEPEVMAGYSKDVRNCRHELWVDLINACSGNRGYKCGDIKCRDFYEKMINIFPNLKTNNDGNLNKTPDILFWYKEVIYVGDVTVTVDTEGANKNKTMKYKFIADDFIKAGASVVQMNLIVKSNCETVNNVLQTFVRSDIIDEDQELFDRAIEFTKLANRVLESCREKCTNPIKLQIILDEMDHIERGPTLETELPNFIQEMEFKEYKPIRSEMEVIEMIKNEIDRIESSGDYFDTGMEETNKAFDKLLEMKEGARYSMAKSTLKICENSHDIETMSNHDLIRDFISDISTNQTDKRVTGYIHDLLPTNKQLLIMKELYKTRLTSSKSEKSLGIYGPYQYERTKNSENILTMVLNTKLLKSSKNPNAKQSPKTIMPENYPCGINQIVKMIDYYGSVSKKKSFLSDTWEAKTNFEHENSKDMLEIYEYVKSTNGVQTAHSLSNFYQRLMHMKASEGRHDNIYIPPNGSFICVVPKNHAPVTKSGCEMPMIFICREAFSKEQTELEHCEHEYSFKTNHYLYKVSKLCRLNVDKIANWDQAGYRLVSCSSYLLNTCKNLNRSRDKVVGLLTLLMLDVHQKTSEFLDLLKYVAYMPFSDLSRLSKLVADKFNIMIKTNLDCWLLTSMRSFMNELSKAELLNASKPKLLTNNTMVVSDSLGLDISLPSFCDMGIRHENAEQYIEEISMIFIVRPKHLFGEQSLDKSIDDTVGWSMEYRQEKVEHRGWATDGHDVTSFPFKSKFCFSSDAIYYAQQYTESKFALDRGKVSKKLAQTTYGSFMHDNCSLRGCTKEKAEWDNKRSLHTTSLDACLRHYELNDFEDSKCTAKYVAINHLEKNLTYMFSQSAKDQRGSHRSISTPTLGTKACLMMIEKPESAIGSFINNNIVVPGKHKLSIQSETYRKALADGSAAGFKQVYQIAEDQTKFSENDNINKFKNYITNNTFLPVSTRKLQLACLKRLEGREHLVHRMPSSISNDKDKSQFISKDGLGITVEVGWPQGMLNFISTSIHSIADYWILDAYNKAYPERRVLASGLVHSDDSWVVVACNSKEDFKRFTLFRIVAKKLFCLKINEKKLWASKYLGELVSNYNINGNVHLSVAKTLANSFGNLIYQNWIIDVHSQVSSLQQCYRNGATLPVIIMMCTILKQQMLDCYQVKGLHKTLISFLPVELGGYPDCSAYELAVTGVECHYTHILKYVQSNPRCEIAKIIHTALSFSLQYNVDKELTESLLTAKAKNSTDILKNFILPVGENGTIMTETLLGFKELDYETIVIPSRGEVFSCIKHIMPKSTKLAMTLQRIRELPYETDGMEMIITRPRLLSTSLGHLKARTGTMVYELAADGFTKSSRKLAIAQAIQSSGKVVKIANMIPMSMSQLIEVLYKTEIKLKTSHAMLDIAFSDESNMTYLCSDIVYVSTNTPTNIDKRKLANRMPYINDKYDTLSKMKYVLTYIIDSKLKTNYLKEYPEADPIEVLKIDSHQITTRFQTYFSFYDVKKACNLIMQQYMARIRSKLWIQPYLNNKTMQSFLQDLYGKTVNDKYNYKIHIGLEQRLNKTHSAEIIKTAYSLAVLNTIYEDKFKATHIGGIPIKDAIKNLDTTNLDDTDTLKLGIIEKIHCGTIFHLKKYDSSKLYTQNYEIKQKYVNGKYVGNFKVNVRYGNTVVMIEGVPGNVKIKVSNANIKNITMAMFIFVNDNHKAYSYEHYTYWHKSEFWRSLSQGDRYLMAFNNITVLQLKWAERAIPTSIDDSLTIRYTDDRSIAEDFVFDDTLRVVFKKVGGRSQRTANVKQDLSMPKIDDFRLKSEMIEGFQNNRLVKNGLITNLTLNRFSEISRSNIKDILMERKLDSIPIINFYKNIINAIRSKAEPITLTHVDTDTIEIEEVKIEAVTAGNAFIRALGHTEKILTTSPEDLTSLDCYTDNVPCERSGALYKHPSLSRLLANIYNMFTRRDEVHALFWKLFQNNEFKQKLREIREDDEEFFECMDYHEESKYDLKPDLEVYSFVVGHELDLEKMNRKYNIKNFIKHRPDRYLYNMDDLSDKFVDTLTYDFFGESKDESEIIKPEELFD